MQTSIITPTQLKSLLELLQLDYVSVDPLVPRGTKHLIVQVLLEQQIIQCSNGYYKLRKQVKLPCNTVKLAELINIRKMPSLTTCLRGGKKSNEVQHANEEVEVTTNDDNVHVKGTSLHPSFLSCSSDCAYYTCDVPIESILQGTDGCFLEF